MSMINTCFRSLSFCVLSLSDFGFAMDMVNPASTPCGSYSYAAPELFELAGTTYDPRRTDAWSM